MRLALVASVLPFFAYAAEREGKSGRETLNCEKVFSFYTTQVYEPGQELDLKFSKFSPKNNKLEVVVDLPPSSGFGLASGETRHDPGTMYEPSMIYCKYGYKEEKLGNAISVPHTISCKKQGLFVLPSTQKIPQHVPIAEIGYYVRDLKEGYKSCPGRIYLLNSDKMLTASVFDDDNEGWSIENNGRTIIPPTHDSTSLGNLNDFIHASEADINLVDGLDQNLWQFVAPEKFLGDFAVAYGGTLSFTIATTTGPFELSSNSGKTFNNDPTLPQVSSDGNIPVVTLYCETCLITRSQTNEGTRGEYGVRLVYPLSQLPSLWKNGQTSAKVTIPLKENSGWLLDPRNINHQMTPVTKCELATVLHRLSKVSIFGDYSPGVETVALDDVKVQAGRPVPKECHRDMFPQAYYKPKQRTASRKLPPSYEFVPVTQTITFADDTRICPKTAGADGSQQHFSAIDRQVFLQECTKSFTDQGISVKCVDVKCGSVIVSIQGQIAAVNKAVETAKKHGVNLPSFPNPLTVKAEVVTEVTPVVKPVVKPADTTAKPVIKPVVEDKTEAPKTVDEKEAATPKVVLTNANTEAPKEADKTEAAPVVKPVVEPAETTAKPVIKPVVEDKTEAPKTEAPKAVEETEAATPEIVLTNANTEAPKEADKTEANTESPQVVDKSENDLTQAATVANTEKPAETTAAAGIATTAN